MNSIPSIASDKLLKMKFMQRGSQSHLSNRGTTHPHQHQRKSGGISKKEFPFKARRTFPHPGLRIDFSSSFLDFMDSSSSTLGRRIHTFEGTKPLDHTSSSVLASSFPTTSSETSSPPPSKKPRLASPKTLPQRPTSSYHPKTRAAAKLLAGPVPKVQHD